MCHHCMKWYLEIYSSIPVYSVLLLVGETNPHKIFTCLENDWYLNWILVSKLNIYQLTIMATATVISSKIEIHTVIRFLRRTNYKPLRTHKKVCEVYGDKIYFKAGSRNVVCFFKNFRMNIIDDSRVGRPSTSKRTHNIVRFFLIRALFIWNLCQEVKKWTLLLTVKP